MRLLRCSWMMPRSARSQSLPPQTRSCSVCQDRTNDPIDAIVEDLVSFKVPGVAVLDPTKAGEIGIRTAIAVKPKRAEAKIQNLITEEQFKEGVQKCTQCNECAFVCPPHIRISKLMDEAVKGEQAGSSPTLMRSASDAEGASRSARRA